MRLFIMTLALLFSAAPALAGADDGLYAPPVPDGAAVVRFLNHSDTNVDVKANGKSFGVAPANVFTPYFVVKAGKADIDMGGQKYNGDLAAGKRYTALLTGGKNPALLEDPTGDNRAKATVVLYNLSSAPITLKAKAGTAPVIENVAPDASGHRELNGVKVDFSVHGADGKQLTNLTPVILERGLIYGIVFDGAKATLSTAQTDTRK